MQIVIDIPREQYSLIMQSHRSGVTRFIDKEAMMYAIKSGMLLPKGHGRLIDADKTLKNAEEIYNASNIKDIINPVQMYTIREILTNAPTIIKVDKVERSDKE